MNAQQAREYTINRPLKLEPANVKDFWPDLDGQVFLQDVPGDQLSSIQLLLKDDGSKMMAATLIKALVIKDKDAPDAPAEPMYQTTDRDTVAHLGASVLLPLMEQMTDFLGMGTDALDALKKS